MTLALCKLILKFTSVLASTISPENVCTSMVKIYLSTLKHVYKRSNFSFVIESGVYPWERNKRDSWARTAFFSWEGKCSHDFLSRWWGHSQKKWWWRCGEKVATGDYFLRSWWKSIRHSVKNNQIIIYYFLTCVLFLKKRACCSSFERNTCYIFWNYLYTFLGSLHHLTLIIIMISVTDGRLSTDTVFIMKKLYYLLVSYISP